MLEMSYRALEEALDKGQTVRSVTFLDGEIPSPYKAGDMLVEPWSGQLESSLTAVATDLSPRRGQLTTALVWGGGRSCRVLVELHEPWPRLLLVGAGHIARALAVFASRLEYRILVYDDLSERLDPDLFPMGTILSSGSFDQVAQLTGAKQGDWALIVTRGHEGDYQALLSLVRCPLTYLGMIGSRRKTSLLFERARKDGVDPADLARVWSPVGLDIAAETPEEIAVSIIAEMIALRRGHDPRQTGSCRRD